MTAMRILHDSLDPGRPAPALLVLLPGALQQPEHLLQHGYVAAVRKRRLALDIALADLAMRTIVEAADGSAVDRLERQLLQPASDSGAYRQIWLAGISLGGFLALAHAARYPGRAGGLCLLAPYPGNRLLTGAIVRAGGAASWAAGMRDGAGEDRDDEALAWRWLAQKDDAGAPEIHLGYGRQDRFACGQRLMADSLPPARVSVLDGGHDWPTWNALWQGFLDRNAGRFAA